jgi:hypothetical protein
MRRKEIALSGRHCAGVNPSIRLQSFQHLFRCRFLGVPLIDQFTVVVEPLVVLTGSNRRNGHRPSGHTNTPKRQEGRHQQAHDGKPGNCR